MISVKRAENKTMMIVTVIIKLVGEPLSKLPVRLASQT